MYFLYRQIKKRIDASKTKENAAPSTTGNDSAVVEQKPAARKENFSQMDRTTPAGRNMLCVNIVGLVAAFDYSASLMSIQPMYYILNGDGSLFGLCLGVYDLAFILCAPFCAKFLAKTNRYMTVFAFSMVLSILGNILYSLTIYFDYSTSLAGNSWILLFIARALMGAGSVNLIAGSTYITHHTRFEHRLGAMGTYQNFQAVSRMVGPLIGFLFLALPFPLESSSAGIQLFNFYTMNGWLMALVSLFGLFAVFLYFSPSAVPNFKDEAANGVELKHYDVWTADKRVGSIFYKISINCLLVLVFGYVDYSILGQLFAFGTAQFKVVNTQYDMWQPFVGVGAGSATAAIVWRRIAARWNHPTQEVIWCAVGLATGFVVPWMFINYGGPSATTSPPALMYIGTVFLGIAQVMSFTNLEVIFSKQLTQHLDEVGASIGPLFSFYGISQAVSRFLGPFVTGFVIPIVNSKTGGEPCLTASGSFDFNSTCCITASAFSTETCELLNVDVYLPIMVVISAIATALGMYFTFRVVDYGTISLQQPPQLFGEVQKEQPVSNEQNAGDVDISNGGDQQQQMDGNGIVNGEESAVKQLSSV